MSYNEIRNISFSVDYLQDAEILQQYIARLSLLGWTTKQEFEEIWMCLLQVLTVSKDDLTDAEVGALSQSSALVIQAITQLLLHTMKMPIPGQNLVCFPIHSPRSMSSAFYSSERGKQLNNIQYRIDERLTCKENTCTMIGAQQAQLLASSDNLNLERIHASDVFTTFTPEFAAKENRFHHRYAYLNYGVGQLDISYIRNNINENTTKENRGTSPTMAASINSKESLQKDWVTLYLMREECLNKSGLDLTLRSCLNLLIQTLYSQWLLPIR